MTMTNCSPTSTFMDYGIGHAGFLGAFKSRSGDQLTSMDIKKAVRKEYPNCNWRHYPQRHDDDHNKGECKCAGTGNDLFKRLGRNSYQVR